jgi:hypothetical protein
MRPVNTAWDLWLNLAESGMSPREIAELEVDTTPDNRTRPREDLVAAYERSVVKAISPHMCVCGVCGRGVGWQPGVSSGT